QSPQDPRMPTHRPPTPLTTDEFGLTVRNMPFKCGQEISTIARLFCDYRKAAIVNAPAGCRLMSMQLVAVNIGPGRAGHVVEDCALDEEFAVAVLEQHERGPV